MKTFEPTPKAIALREYAKFYECRLMEPPEKESPTSWILLGIANVFLALGGTTKELDDVRAIAEKIKGYEEEKAMQA